MQIVRLHCPACSAALSVPAGNTSVICEYCGSNWAISGSSIAQPEVARPAIVTQAPVMPPLSPPAHTPMTVPTSVARGCVAALLAVFILAPLLTILMMLPILPFLPEDAAGNTQTPDVIALCYGIFMFLAPPALGIYAFLHFRLPQHSIGGFFTAPFRRLMRLVRR